MSICPVNRFSTIRYERVKAVEAKRIMDTSLHRGELDQAIKDYTRALDRIMVELNALAEEEVLEEIAYFLNEAFGFPVEQDRSRA